MLSDSRVYDIINAPWLFSLLYTTIFTEPLIYVYNLLLWWEKRQNYAEGLSLYLSLSLSLLLQFPFW